MVVGDTRRASLLALALCMAGVMLSVVATRVAVEAGIYDSTVSAVAREIIDEVRRYPFFSSIVYGAGAVPWLILSLILRYYLLRSRPSPLGIGLCVGGVVTLCVSLWCYLGMWRSIADPERGTSTGALGFVTIPLLTSVIAVACIGSAYLIKALRKHTSTH